MIEPGPAEDVREHDRSSGIPAQRGEKYGAHGKIDRERDVCDWQQGHRGRDGG